MNIADYLAGLKESKLLVLPEQKCTLNIQVKGIAYNSEKVEKDYMFFVKGKKFKKEYLQDALKKGANVIVSESLLNEQLTSTTTNVVVTDINSAMSIAGDIFYQRPWDRINTIGITGTKGKSTTAFLTKTILNEGEPKDCVGITSSIKNYYGNAEEIANLTTPEALDVYSYLNKSVNNGLKHFIMEVSSQGLKYGRLTGINYDIGCFLNFGKDHISELEHPNLEDYFESKKKLIFKSKCAIINVDIPQHKEIIKEAIDSPYNEQILTFGTCERADIYGYDLEELEEGLSFKVRTKDFDEEFFLPIKGRFNFSNSLCAIAIAYKCGVGANSIKSGLKKAKVEGRMEFHIIDDREVLFDYAHNDLSYKALKEFVETNYKERPIYSVFGCVGERGQDRRRSAGRIIGGFSDKAYIVSHKPGSEKPKEICKQIEEGIKSTNCDYEIILDRKDAIRKALDDIPIDGLLIITCCTSELLKEL